MSTLPIVILIPWLLLSRVEAENRFERGCLYSKNLTNKIRVCSSEDPPEAAVNGICRPPPIDYEEIRLLPSDWESTFFEVWILQIALSEMLNVPTSLEMGDPNLQLDFYHPDSPMDFPVNSDWKKSMETAHLLNGDCSTANRNKGDEYEVCGHFNPESWQGRSKEVQDMVARGVVEPPKALGMITQEGWFVPKFTAERDPSLLSYIGLQGEDNRQNLADRFHRPTTWKDYCDQVSPTNCTDNDGVAKRYPQGDDEPKLLYMEGLFQGHFRATEENDCSLNNETFKCTGHIADYPCGWTSPVGSQIHHLQIALDTSMDQGGYSYDELSQVWHAANATKSDVIMYWWSQDLLYDEFFGTEAEFIPVTMPAATQECITSRPDGAARCSPDPDIRVGPPEAVCGEPPKNLHGVMSTTVYDQAYDGRCAARHSPSHTALTSYQLSELQLEEIFARWIRLDDSGEADPRAAVCEWISDNMDYMQQFVPRTYPRSMEAKDEKKEPLLYASTISGLFVMVLVITTLVFVHRYKERKAIAYAQIEFLDLLLLGSILIATGAVLMGMPASNFTCMASIFFINLGYTLELVPLIVKIGALLHVMQLGKRMQRVEIKRDMLFGVVTIISVLMVTFLFVWSLVDSPSPTPEYELSKEVDDDGETIVWEVDVCKSDSQVWSYISVAWNATLLFITTALAIKMRKLTVRGFNETPTLALLVYSHLFFVVLRVITYVLSSTVSGYTLARCLSLIFSADTLATLVIYFAPKFLATEDQGGSTIRISGSGFNQSTDWYSARFSNGSSHQHFRRAISVSRDGMDSEAPPAFSPVEDEEHGKQTSTRFCCSINIGQANDSKTDVVSATVGDAVKGRNPAHETGSHIQKRLSQTLQLSNWIVMGEDSVKESVGKDKDPGESEQEEKAKAGNPLSLEKAGGEEFPDLQEMDSLMEEIERLERKTNSLQLEKDFQSFRLVRLQEENEQLTKLSGDLLLERQGATIYFNHRYSSASQEDDDDNQSWTESVPGVDLVVPKAA